MQKSVSGADMIRAHYILLFLSIYFAIARTRMDLGAMLLARIPAWVLFRHLLRDISEQNIMTDRSSPATRRKKEGARCHMPRGLSTCVMDAGGVTLCASLNIFAKMPVSLHHAVAMWKAL